MPSIFCPKKASKWFLEHREETLDNPYKHLGIPLDYPHITLE
jgi:hypothetical protein